MAGQDRDLDPAFMALRASCLRLREYVHARMIDSRSTVRSEEIYARLTRCLYPKADLRQEPLKKLLDRARAAEVKDFRRILEEALERIEGLSLWANNGAKIKKSEIVKEKADGIAGDIRAFLMGLDAPPSEDLTDENPAGSTD